MNYLHIMPPSQRMMLTYVEMLRKNFPAEQHRIVLCEPIAAGDAGLLLYDNVVPFEALGNNKFKRLKNITEELNKADRIVFHSFMPTKIWNLAIFLNQSILDRSLWVVWGIDLYNYQRPRNGFRNKLFNNLGYKFRSRMRYPVVVSEPDAEEYNKRFGTHVVKYAPYAFADSRFELMDKAKEEKKDDPIFLEKLHEYADPCFAGEISDDSINIQVCHNGFSFNKHFEVLNYLQPLLLKKEEKQITLYLPLSYGNDQLTKKVTYKDALTSYIKQKFVSKVVVLSKIMPNNYYTKYLSMIDVAIFNAPRHNALGNILQLLYMGKKVYLSSKSPLLDYLCKKGLRVHTVDELKNITYDELIKMDDNSEAPIIIKDMFSVDVMLKRWQDIFEQCEKYDSFQG